MFSRQSILPVKSGETQNKYITKGWNNSIFFKLTAFVALSLFYLQGQIEGPDREVDSLGIDSSHLFGDTHIHISQLRKTDYKSDQHIQILFVNDCNLVIISSLF